MVGKNETSNLWQRQSFVNKMIVVLFQISARAWPLKTMNCNCKEAQLVVEWSFHNEPSGLINGFVSHSELTESNGFVVHHELIELINGLVGHIELTELISLVLDGHMKDFQQGAVFHFNDGRLLNYSIVGFQRVVELIQILNSEGERDVSKSTSRLIADLISAKHTSKLIVICNWTKISLIFREECTIFL